MALVAVLSNPESDGNKSRLARVREYCARNPEILHIEVERSEDMGVVLNKVAFARPKVLVLNGGDGTVQAVLTEMFGEGAPDRPRPPIAVLPNGKTNLIAKDLGATGDPIRALGRIVELAETGLSRNLVGRQLISLDTGNGERPQLGMFLAAGALADVLLYCRHKLYPTGMPNGLAHTITLFAGLISVLTEWSSSLLPPKPPHIRVVVGNRRVFDGRFQVLMVSTLRALVLSGSVPAEKEGTLQLLAIERNRMTGIRTVIAGLSGRLGRVAIPGIHFEMGDEIRIEDERANVIMDGETFTAEPGKAIVLKPTPRVGFLHVGRNLRAPEGAPGEVPLIPPQPAPQAAGVAHLSDAR